MNRPKQTGEKLELETRSETGSARVLGHPLLACLLLAAVTFLVYWPVRNFEFINFDDHDYVSENYHVLGGVTWPGAVWAFRTGHASNWHPLTWLSHMLDVEWSGPGPRGPHLTNLLFHVANTLLVFLLLRRLTGLRPADGGDSSTPAGAHWRSVFVAAVFGLHPLHVESVAWISERKDVLSTFFGLLALLAYTRYVSGAGCPMRGVRCQVSGGEEAKLETRNSKLEGSGSRITHHASRWYLLCLIGFALSLMSKPMWVTLPALLLLLDYWPLERLVIGDWRLAIWPLVREKIPFFLLSAASSVVTFLAQQSGGAVQSMAGYSWSMRLENALVSYARYLGKVFWPVDLALPYPHPGHWPATQVLLAGGLVVAACAAAVVFGRKRRFLFVGWFWYLGLLVPVIGLVQVGAQAMADRYLYVPMIGVLIFLTWGAAERLDRSRVGKALGAALGILAAGACAWCASEQLSYWRDSGTLARHAIAVTKNNDIAYSNLGNHLLERGQLDEAIESFRQALRTMWPLSQAPADPVAVLIDSTPGGASDALLRADPKKLRLCADLLNNLATALARQGRVDEGIGLFRIVLKIKPDHAMALHNLAFELAAKKEYAQAIPCYEASLRARPELVKTYNSLGTALFAAGRVDEAIARYRAGLQLAPNDADILSNLGLALAGQGQVADAILQYEAALRADPGRIETQNSLVTALIGQGKLDEAQQRLQALLQQKPDCAPAHDNLGVVLAMRGRLDEAIAQFVEALQHDPANAKTHFNLGNVLALQRRFDEAARQYRETLRLIPDHPQAHCHLGGVLAEMGRREEAIGHLREALRLKPDYAAAAQQLQALNAPLPP